MPPAFIKELIVTNCQGWPIEEVVKLPFSGHLRSIGSTRRLLMVEVT